MTTYVYDFTQGDKDRADLLGGKGANLAEMTRLGLPVPPGFTITTEACREYLAQGDEPGELRVQVTTALRHLEDKVGRRLGTRRDPLLVSVRSGARFSMPGMMETVLNVGLNDESVQGLAEEASDERFAWDSYRRLIQMFGATVLGIPADVFSSALDDAMTTRGRAAGDGPVADVDLTAQDLRELVATYRGIVRERTGRDFPQDPREQLDLAIRAVFDSWNTDRARLYRRRERIPQDLGTAVNVVTMVFGNLGDTSGTGVAFTRDPATGAPGAYGDYLQNAQGEDVVAGIRNTLSLDDLHRIDPLSHQQLLQAMRRLETHYRDLCDVEFTVERGHLWMLQTRVGKRTPAAAFRIATALVDEQLITEDEALQRVTGEQLASLLFPQFATEPSDDGAASRALTSGMAASPGAAVGTIVLRSEDAVAAAGRGERVILVRRETNPDDLGGMIAAQGILTARGGKTSHAAVVARGMGRTCVVGAEELDVDEDAGTVTVRASGREPTVLHAGDEISIDGSTGEVFLGAVPVVSSPVERYLEEGLDAVSGDGAAVDDETLSLVRSVDRLLRHADERRRLRVKANADVPDDAARARRLGAQGIGLARTEHMFLGERRGLVEQIVLADDVTERDIALDRLLPLQRDDFSGLLDAMDGLPVTIRLLDPPLHEFLPDHTELAVRVAVERSRREGGGPGELSDDELAADEKKLAALERLHEANPMLGVRGVRLGLLVPGLFAMQVRAVVEAAVGLVRDGKDPRPEIMVPLVGSVRELQIVRDEVESVVRGVTELAGVDLTIPVGTMIELPRAALTAHRIATEADFFSFGTNDLTQTTWGFSRDDVERTLFSTYLDNGVLTISPFETIDADGVGRLVRIAVEESRTTKPGLELGVCGEHGGDPESIRFFHDAGLDYVSCSPFRVPVARLEAGRAATTDAPSSSSR
ncbi:pyruvate, phosphate dikinase [Luteimicrobium xylanilyticum]|uniref:Pyruvate, phosphate dikinase n=1 Tax=Luteimicrobium xylanilyticum TaxID=1133546 RepID=A0A5P9Q699_9MICO|nr:pyruvate, phosphate dikinase [Luteimicrobium xylanilyticum]QFU96630.1 Pyruvate, phosphate dikinase [Luteimicrobium xylanilyticum]